MASVIKDVENLNIQLEELQKATNNFRNGVIGKGGFGWVYKGEVSLSTGKSIVAIKRLNQNPTQGPDFIKEIIMLPRYRHDNIISLLGYCDEAGEKILVYEFASNGSLDKHLSNSNLTWTQRLKICLGAAKGLFCLHDPRGGHQRLVHCDIKSANILLNENWNAKIGDFGLVKQCPANQPNTVVITNPRGTPGYCDPLLYTEYKLTKESDIYSFGVVLLEILCGRLCLLANKGEKNWFLVPIWKTGFIQKTFHEFIYKDLTKNMDLTSLEIFSDIAFQCLKKLREDRPTISFVIEKLEMALEYQELYDKKQLQERGYEEILKAVASPVKYRSIDELKVLLSNGVFLDKRKTWFYLNDKEQRCVMISIVDCLIPYEQNKNRYFTYSYNSRFPVGSLYELSCKFQTRVRTEFLTPYIKYTVNLVFKFDKENEKVKQFPVGLKYQLDGDIESSISYLAYKSEDNWWRVELFQFTSEGKNVDLQILFQGSRDYIVEEGIEFQPMEKAAKHEDETSKEVDMLSVSDSDDIINLERDGVQWATKKEVINNDKEWFFFDKNGKRCYMLSARAAFVSDPKTPPSWESLPESRFREAYVVGLGSVLRLHNNIKSQEISPQTTYACYLVYKLPYDQSRVQGPMEVKYDGLDDYWYAYLVSPQTPVINRKVDQNIYNPVSRPKLKGIPQQRSDGWMEVQVWEFETATTTEITPMCLTLTERCDLWFIGFIIQGIEFRPI